MQNSPRGCCCSTGGSHFWEETGSEKSGQLKAEPRESSGCNLESQGLGRGPEDRASGCSGTEDEADEECRGGQARRLRARHQGPLVDSMGFLSGPTDATQRQALVSRVPIQVRPTLNWLSEGQMGQDHISDVASGGGSPTTVSQGCPMTQGLRAPSAPLSSRPWSKTTKTGCPEVRDPLWPPGTSGPA